MSQLASSIRRIRRALDREHGQVRWFLGHSEFFAFYWRRKFHWLPEVHSVSMSDDGDGAHHTLFVRWLTFSINLTLCKSTKGDPCDGPSYGWGWQFSDDTFSLNFGRRSLTLDIPFLRAYHTDTQILDTVTREVLWRSGKGRYDWAAREATIKKSSQTLPYRYVCDNGEVQDVDARVHVERWVWRRKWTPLKIVKTSMEVQFSEEVGERRGSWKGGCVGCSYYLRPGESVEQCLRRMESERRFR